MKKIQEIIDQKIENTNTYKGYEIEDTAEIIAKDKRYKSKEKKEATRKQRLEYTKGYNKKKYEYLNLCMTPDEKVQLLVQAELSGMSASQYVLSLVHKDNRKFRLAAYAKAFSEFKTKVDEGKKNDKTISSIIKKENEDKKEEIRQNTIKEATEYFGKDPFSIPKKDRVKFIFYKTDNGKIKGNIQDYCDALDITRAWYYYCYKKLENGESE